MNELMIFDNPKFGKIRTLEEDGKVLFCGKDVATALGYKNTRDAINRHCKGVVKRDGVSYTTNQHGTTTEQAVEMAFIPVGDIYRLAAKSELPGADEFESWIFDEVIPSVLKHGAYMTPETIEKVLADPDTIIQLATTLKLERSKRQALEAELDRSREWYSIKRVAHMNGRSHKDFNWRRLKEESEKQGYGVKKIFDANYGEVNTYHINVWEKVYPNMEL